MAKSNTKTADEIEAGIKQMRNELRAARRAEKVAAEALFLDHGQAFTAWLFEVVNVTTVEGIDALRSALDADQVREYLVKRAGVENSTTTAPDDDASASESVHGYGGQP